MAVPAPVRPRRRARAEGGAALCAAIVCGAALAWARRNASAFLSAPLSLTSGLRGSCSGSAAMAGCAPGAPGSRLARQAVEVDDDEYMEVWDQSTQELSLDVRELLITDANVYFVGPDLDSYRDSLDKVADLLNYTVVNGDWADLMQGTETIDNLESIFVMPPLVSVQRWSWSVLRQGLVVWIDPDGYEHLNVYERDRIRKLKFPKKKAKFGPAEPPSLLKPSEEPNGDPIDMWMEADVHVDVQGFKERGISIEKAIMGSIINAILESPPKWRGWMKQAKIRGTIGNDYETPFEARRSFHSNGISPRLNRLLNA